MARKRHYASGTDNVNTNGSGMQTMPGQGGTWGSDPTPPLTPPEPSQPRTTFGLRKPAVSAAGGMAKVPSMHELADKLHPHNPGRR